MIVFLATLFLVIAVLCYYAAAWKIMTMVHDFSPMLGFVVWMTLAVGVPLALGVAVNSG